MKYLIILLVVFTTLLACEHGQGPGHTKHDNTHDNHHAFGNALTNQNITDSLTNFPTVGFRKTYQKIIPFPIEKVFPLFEPQGRPLLYRNWDPIILREGGVHSLEGQIEYSKYDELDVFLTVTEHNLEQVTV